MCDELHAEWTEQGYALSWRTQMAACVSATQTQWYAVGSQTQTAALPSRLVCRAERATRRYATWYHSRLLATSPSIGCHHLQYRGPGISCEHDIINSSEESEVPSSY